MVSSLELFFTISRYDISEFLFFCKAPERRIHSWGDRVNRDRSHSARHRKPSSGTLSTKRSHSMISYSTQECLPRTGSTLTCGLMLCGMPASTRERSLSECGRVTSILSQVRSPTSWLCVNSRCACHLSLCCGSSVSGTPRSLLEFGSAPSASAKGGERNEKEEERKLTHGRMGNRWMSENSTLRTFISSNQNMERQRLVSNCLLHAANFMAISKRLEN